MRLKKYLAIAREVLINRLAATVGSNRSLPLLERVDEDSFLIGIAI
jgi:hypothetical protein